MAKELIGGWTNLGSTGSLAGVIIVTRISPGERPYLIWTTVGNVEVDPAHLIDRKEGCLDFGGGLNEPRVMVIGYSTTKSLTSYQSTWLEAHLQSVLQSSGKGKWLYMVHDDKVVRPMVSSLFNGLTSNNNSFGFLGHWFHHPTDYHAPADHALILMTGCLATVIAAANALRIGAAVPALPEDRYLNLFGELINSLDLYGDAVTTDSK